MIQFDHEEVTPNGGWNYKHPVDGIDFNKNVFWVLRDAVQAHNRTNGYPFSEEEFRENVAIHTPAASIINRQELGDFVAKLAQPIARQIDRMASAVGVRTDIENCGGCKKRREKLNELSRRLRG